MTDELHVHGDFETRSAIDLVKAGSYRYFESDTTDLLCFSYAIGDGPVMRWHRGDSPPTEFNYAIKHGLPFFGHNVGFERLALRRIAGPRYGFAVPPLEQCHCTLAMASTIGLPKSLDGAAMAIGLAEKKDSEGRRVMLQLSKPRAYREDGSIVWWEREDVPAKFDTLYRYCDNDVVVERALTKKLRPLSEFERKVWLQNQIINDRGVPVDVDAVHDAIWTLHYHAERLSAELKQLTNGVVPSANAAAKLREWLNEHRIQIEENDDGEIEVYEMKELSGVDRRSITNALKEVRDPRVRRVLEIRQELAKSSVKKLNAFYQQTNFDRRARGHIKYHTASTGRDGGAGIQMQNLPRPSLNANFEPNFTPADLDFAFENLKQRDPVLLEQTCGPPTLLVADMLRGMIRPPKGHRFISGDFSNIEGRVLAWLAGDSAKVKAFRDYDAGEGPDIYKRTAARILGITPEQVTKSQRQVYGKVPELALGFGGGKGAFQTMAKNSNVVVSDAQADEIKVGWREGHPEIVQFWYDLENAALRAVRHGKKQEVNRVAYAYANRILWCKLPSGRLLAYIDAQIRDVETPWGETKEAVTYMTVVSEGSKSKIISGTKRWGRIPGYGGLFAENVTQAAARDVLKCAELRLEAAGYPLILPVHDEENAEVPLDFGSAEEFERIMVEPEPWMDGLPVAAEVEILDRYRK